VQARSAILFASRTYNRRKFLIITDDDPFDAPYTKKMPEAYHVEITEEHAELKGVRDMASLPSEADLRKLDPDCILYIGGAGEAQVLQSVLSSMNLNDMHLMVMLSDSVVESRGRDADLAVFGAPLTEVAVQRDASFRRNSAAS